MNQENINSRTSKYFGTANDFEKELEYYEIAQLSLEEFKDQEKRRPDFYPESELVHFYFYTQLHAIDYSRLDILRHLDKGNNLIAFTSHYFDAMCQANNPQVIDFYLYEKNIKITNLQLKKLQHQYADTGIWQKVEKRDLEKSVSPPSSLLTASPTPLNKV